MGILNRVVTVYKGWLTNHFMVVQSVQTGLLVGTGDIIAQTIAEKKPLKEIDLSRTGCFVTLGACFVGPTLTTWFKFLHKKFPDTVKYVAFKKMFTDQLFFVPPFHLALITGINTLQGRDFQFTKDQIRLKFGDILLAAYKLWPAVQIINFYFVPLGYQVLVVQSVALCWNSYLSWKTQQGITKGSH